MESSENLGIWTFLASILGGSSFLGTIFGFLKWRTVRNDAKRIGCFKNGFESIQNINLLLDKMLLIDGVKECIVFRAHNDGGLPKPGHPFYVSASMWSSLGQYDINKLSLSSFKKVDVIGDSLDYLSRIIKGECFTMKVSELRSGHTKLYFSTNGCTNLFFRYITINENSMYYLVIAMDDSISELDINRLTYVSNEICSQFN